MFVFSYRMKSLEGKSRYVKVHILPVTDARVSID